MLLSAHDIARMIDLSAVRADCDEQEVRELAAMARRHGCVCVFSLPAFTPLVVELLRDVPEVHVGGAVGFPSGGDTTACKVFQARELVHMGCHEIDMVINVGLLRSGRIREVEDDMRSVVAAAAPIPVKAILECHHLDEAQIRAACAAAVRAGVRFVKTGTGWAPSGATLDNIALMRRCVCDACGVKAAGGVRDLATLIEMYRRGANRFGIGLRSAEGIFRSLAALPGGVVAVEPLAAACDSVRCCGATATTVDAY